MSSAVFYGGGGISEEDAQVLIDAAVAPLPKHLEVPAPNTNTGWGVMPGYSTNGTFTTGLTLADNTMYYLPFVPPVDVSYTKFTCDVSASGTAFTMGVVELDPADWQPKASGILAQANLTATTGIKISSGHTIDLVGGGLYAMFYIATGTLALERLRVDATQHRTSWFFHTGSAINALSLLTIAGETVGTQSDPMPDWDSVSTGEDGMSVIGLLQP